MFLSIFGIFTFVAAKMAFQERYRYFNCNLGSTLNCLVLEIFAKIDLGFSIVEWTEMFGYTTAKRADFEDLMMSYFAIML